MTNQGFSLLPQSGGADGFVSVVIVNWNRRDLLDACLKSVAAQIGVPFEVIVVDNGSSDGSTGLVQAFAAGAPFPVQLIQNSENLGFCAANNQGIIAARGEFIALLNNDAEAEPEWLAALRSVFSDPGVGMAASKILVWEDPSVIDKVGHLIYPDGQNRGRGTGERDCGQYDKSEEVLWPDGCACMYRKSMLDEIGLFDEDLFAYGDDADLGLRARIAGWRCIYTPKAVVRHHRGSTLGQQNPRRISLIERNRVLLAVKLFPGSLLWRNGAYYLARIGAGVWAALHKRGEIGRFSTPWLQLMAMAALIRGDWQALWMLPQALRKRQMVKKYRKLSPTQLTNLLLQHQISLTAISQHSAHKT